MNRALAGLVNGGVLGVVLTASIALALRLAPRRLLNAATRYAAWWATLAIVLALPAWYLPMPRWNSPAAPPPPIAVSAPLPATAIAPPIAIDWTPLVTPPPAPPRPSIFPIEIAAADWPRWIFAAWLVAAALLIARVAASYFLLARVSARASDAPPPLRRRVGHWLSLCGSARPGVRLAGSSEIATPVAAGPRRPSILLPADLLAALDDVELDHIGLHEAAHLARRDDYALIVQRMIEALFALHPAVRWITRQLDLEREIACDDLVIAATGRTRAYATCLTRIAAASGARSALAAAPAAEGRSHLARRIDHLLDGARHTGTRLLRARFAATIAIAAALACIAGRAPAVVAFAKPLARQVALAAPKALHLPALLPHPAEPQTPAPDFDARVVEDSSGNPLPSAEVRFQRAGVREFAADLDTDREGRIRASGLAPGEYTVTFLKPNYVTASIKLRIPAAPVSIRMVRYGVISGQVTDQQGRPVPGRILAPGGRTAGGARITVLAKSDAGGLAAVRELDIDDEGQYRIYDLPPGQYAIGLWYDGLKDGSGMMLHPDNAHPRFFSIGGGEEHRGVDFQITPRAAFQVAGKVQLPSPKTRFALALGLPDQPLLPIAQTLTADDGAFRFPQIPAGSYELFVAGPDRGYGSHQSLLGPEPRFSRTRVQVNGADVTGLDLAPAPGRSLTVTLRARGSDKPPEGCPQSVEIGVMLLDPWGVFPPSQLPHVAFGKEQTIANLPPGRIRLTAGPLGATCYQTDPPVVDLGAESTGPVAIEIASAASIRGVLRGAGARPSDFTVVLIAADASAAAEARIASPGADGRFQFDSLPPGRYRIAARPTAAGSKARWIADTSSMIEIQAPGGAPTDVELPAPKKGDAQ